MHGAPGEHRPRRGLKIHALLLYYVCTNGQHLSHRKRGGCCPFFCWPPGACTRVSTAHSPIGRGGCCLFFPFGPRGLTRHQFLPSCRGGDAGPFFLVFRPLGLTAMGTTSPPTEGLDAVRFSVAPPREVCYRKFGWHPFQHSRYRCEPMAASRPRMLQSSHASMHQCLLGIGVVLKLS